MLDQKNHSIEKEFTKNDGRYYKQWDHESGYPKVAVHQKRDRGYQVAVGYFGETNHLGDYSNRRKAQKKTIK